MGHAVNSTGFRLLRERHWVEGVSAGLYSVLDRFLLQLFHLHLPHHLYSHLLLHPTPSGRLHLHLHLYSHLWVALLRRRRRLRRFRGGGRRGGGRHRFRRRSDRFYRFLRWREFCRLHLLLSTLLGRLPVVGSGFRLHLHPVRFTPPLLLRSFVPKVRQQQRLVRILNSFLDRKFSRLSKQGVVGILLRAAGRFTRRQRASALQVRRGTVPFSTISTYIDRFSLPLVLKYGRCNLQVWVAYKSRRRRRRSPFRCSINRFPSPVLPAFRPPLPFDPILPPSSF